MQNIIDFTINYYQILATDGQIINSNLHSLEFQNNNHNICNDLTTLLNIYTCMQKTRLFDAKIINLQKTGLIGTYPSSLWHEAIGVAIGSSMHAQDIFCPYYRDLGTMLWRGIRMEEILGYWGGYGGYPLDKQVKLKHTHPDFPICIPIASQTLHAAGAAFALKHQGLNHVVVTTIGDGGTSRGDFYEALNLAKTWQLPVVFIIINNQFAISTPRNLQTKATTLAQKAIAAGIEGEQVDGNDILALRARIALAIENARINFEPKVIEAITYRMSDHTTADDASRYRGSAEISQYLKTDPLIRFKNFLTHNFQFSNEDDAQITLTCNHEIQQAVDKYLNLPPIEPANIMFDYLYANLPTHLTTQRNSVC